MKPISTSLFITTYKRPDFLAKVLESVLRLKPSPDEILIAEDGQCPENRLLIEAFQLRSQVPVHHVSHEDLGNRKPLIMNKAILKSSGEFLIFVDGDCVLRDDFIQAHWSRRSSNSFLTGRRVDLSPKMSDFLTVERIGRGYLEGWTWRLYRDALWGSTRSLGRMFRTPRFLRSLLGQDRIIDIRGCNFSVDRQHLFAINGFSNNFSGAYGEDSDVEHRLKFLGLNMRSVKGAAIQFHLYHQEQTKDAQNQVLLEAVRLSRQAQTSNGLSELNF